MTTTKYELWIRGKRFTGRLFPDLVTEEEMERVRDMLAPGEKLITIRREEEDEDNSVRYGDASH